MKFLNKIFSREYVRKTEEENNHPQSSRIEEKEVSIECINIDQKPSENMSKTIFDNGDTIINVSIPEFSEGYPRFYTIKGTGIIYDTGTLEGIASIKEETNQLVNIPNYSWPIEYVLQRLATEYKRNKRMDLAIACLKKSNSIMALKTDYYNQSYFLRLPEYLKQVGDFDGAKKEENFIHTILFPSETNDAIMTKVSELIKLCKTRNTDLVVSEHKEFCSAECAKYRSRVYSISGQDSRYPKFTKKILELGLWVYPFFEDISHLNINGIYMDPIKYSNRPFEDDRTEYEKSRYEESIEKSRLEKIDRADYDWIRENIPDVAPKSFGGYRRMKNSNSVNFKKIIAIAEKQGYNIHK